MAGAGLRTPLLLLALLVALGSAARWARGDDAPTEREIWTFANGSIERQIDVTDMPTFVRKAVVERLAAQGFERRDGPQLARRDLEADVRALVRHGGRFPTGWKPDAAPIPPSRRSARLAALGRRLGRLLVDGLRRVWEAGVGRRSKPPRRPPGGPLGGWIVPQPVGADGQARFRVAAVPAGSAAEILGLRRGDEIAALNGSPPTLAALTQLAASPPRGGKLAVRVVRRRGRTESWEIELILEDATSPPAGPR